MKKTNRKIAWILILATILSLVDISNLFLKTTYQVEASTPPKYRWVKGPNMPIPGWSQFGKSLLLDGRVIFTGGRGGNKKDTWIYNPTTNQWTQGADMPEALDQHGQTTLKDGTVLVTGGWNWDDYSGSQRVRKTNWVYNPYIDVWQVRYDMQPSKRMSHAMSTLPNGDVILSGGDYNDDGGDGYRTDVWRSKNKGLTWERIFRWSTDELNDGLAYQSQIILSDTEILIAGGMKRYKPHYDVIKYNLTNGEKELITTIPTPYNVYSNQYQYTLNPTADGQYVAFGMSQSTPIARTFFYDLEDETWTEGPTMPYRAYWDIFYGDSQGILLPDGRLLFAWKGEIWFLEKNIPPEINFTTPTENQIIHKGNNVPIQWSAYDENGDNLTYTIKIGTTAGGSDLYSGTPNGTTNNTLGRHNFDTSAIALTWNSSTSRYERRIYVTVSANDGYDTAESTRSFLIVNYRPSIIATTAITNHKINTNTPFVLSGKAWDSNGDRIIIQATIGGKTKSQVINVSPTSQPANDNWNLTWSGDDLQEGEYEAVTITITDDKGGSNSIVWNGSITVKDVLKIIDSKIKEHMLPTSSNDIRIIVPNTNVVIGESTTNNATASSIKSNVNSLNADMFFVGKDGSTKNYIESRITEEYAVNTNDVESELAEYILKKIKDINTNIYTYYPDRPNDKIDTLMSFIDAEKDYAGISIQNKLESNTDLIELEKTLEIWLLKPKEGTLQAKYTHDPNIFDNPVLEHPRADELWHTISNIEDEFILKEALESMRGEWTLTMKASDDTGNAKFDKYSDETQINFIVHQAPAAIIYYWEDANNYYFTGENSYDIDFEFSLPDNGIVKYEWYYQLDNGWHKFSQEKKRVTIPKIIGGKPVIGYGLTVTDFHGATGTTREPLLIDPELRAKLYPELDKFNLTNPGIPASEDVKVIDIETIPFAPEKLEFALYQGETRKTPLKTLINPTDITIADSTYYKWQDIRNYQILETLPDGLYTARITAPKADLGLTLTKEWSVRVNTPINLEITSLPSVVRSTDSPITATFETSKYTDTLVFTLFGNTYYPSYVSQGDKKIWSVTFNPPPPNFPRGIYQGVARATTPNGNEEIKIKDVEFIPFEILDVSDVEGKRGEKVKTTIKTTLGANDVQVLLPSIFQRTIQLNEKDYIFGNPNPNATLKRTTSTEMEWEYEFIIPWTQTSPPDGNYTIPIKAVFEGGFEVEDNFNATVNDYLRYYNPGGTF